MLRYVLAVTTVGFAVAVDDPHRYRQVLRQLAEEDHLDRLLGKIGHAEHEDSARFGKTARA